MRVALFHHSLASDWNHGNAHFLRRSGSELLARGHSVAVYEPEADWSFIDEFADFCARMSRRCAG